MTPTTGLVVVLLQEQRTSQVIHDRATMVREVHLVHLCCSDQACSVCGVGEKRRLEFTQYNSHKLLLQFNEMFAVIGPIAVRCYATWVARRRCKVKQNVHYVVDSYHEKEEGQFLLRRYKMKRFKLPVIRQTSLVIDPDLKHYNQRLRFV